MFSSFPSLVFLSSFPSLLHAHIFFSSLKILRFKRTITDLIPKTKYLSKYQGYYTSAHGKGYITVQIMNFTSVRSFLHAQQWLHFEKSLSHLNEGWTIHVSTLQIKNCIHNFHRFHGWEKLKVFNVTENTCWKWRISWSQQDS